MKNNRKVVALLGAATATAVLVSGCSSSDPEPSAFNASSVACESVQAEIDAAQVAVDQAYVTIQASAGTPDEAPATAAATEAQAKVDALVVRQQQCSGTTAATPAPERELVVEAAKEITAQTGGFDKAKMKEGAQVNTAKALTFDAGGGKFSDTKLTNPEVTAAFMASGTPQAKSAMAVAINDAKRFGIVVTQAELQNSANWVALTTGEAVVWKGNSYYTSKANRTNGARVDQPGSVVMVFIPPSQVKAGKVTWAFYVRGACANPQFEPPKARPPAPPGTPPTVVECPPGQFENENGTCIKPKGTAYPDSPPPPASAEPKPVGTAPAPTRPRSPDPTPTNGLPVRDVNPPDEPEVPDSGSGAGDATAKPPVAPSPPAPPPPNDPPSGGIVESD